MTRLLSLCFAAAVWFSAGPQAVASEPAPAYLFHAAMPGRETLDKDKAGGNPFATALIETLAQPNLTLAAFPKVLAERTSKASGGFQSVDGPARLDPPNWRIGPVPAGERRVALVIVISNYTKGAKSLPGAAFDGRRIAAALTEDGFETTLALDPDRAGFTAALAAFEKVSAEADVAALYTTGHGVEIDGTTHLLLGDFPVAQKAAALPDHAVKLATIAAAPRARLNLVFYGGCRNNPFAPKRD